MQKKDGKFHPVAYFSAQTTDSESRYHSFELETLAIIRALEHFRVYLQGIYFVIVTDCASLTLTLQKKQVNPLHDGPLNCKTINMISYTAVESQCRMLMHLAAVTRLKLLVS